VRKLRVIITGGGTGGHIYPALAIAQGLRERLNDAEILYVGTKTGLEAEIVPKFGFPFKTVSVEGFSRPIRPRTMGSVLKAVKGSWESFALVRGFKPDTVIGTGGYVCGPVVLAAALSGVTTVIHEQNAFPGLTNRVLGRFVDKVCVTFEDSIKFFPKRKRVYLTGLPVRPEIISMDREKGINALGLSEGKKTIVIMGGSRGAKSINRAITEIVDHLKQREDIQVFHIAGHAGYEETVSLLEKKDIFPGRGSRFVVVPYLHHMEYALAAADVIVGRAGASFLSEIMVKGIPAILIPYPYAAANHQEFNARSLAQRGAARVILETNLSPDRLFKELEDILDDGMLRTKMAEAAIKLGNVNALNEILDIIIGTGKAN